MFFKIKSLVLLLFVVCNLPQLSWSQKEIVTEKNTHLLLNKAVENWKNDHYETSLKEANLALKKAILLKNNYLIAKSYNVIGVNFDDLFMLEKAFFYYEKSLKYAIKTNDDTLKGKVYNNLANVYFFEKKNYQKGIEFYKKSLFHTERIADTSKIFFRKLNITWAYFQENQYKSGENYLAFLNKHYKKHADESTMVIFNMLNALYAEYQENNQAADRYYQQAIQIGEKSNEKYDLSITYYNYSLFLAKLKKFKEAYRYSKIYEDLNDQILNDSKIKIAKNTGINLEVEEYKREISNISSTFKTKESYWLEQQSNNKKKVIMIISLSLLLFFIFYYVSQNEKFKQNTKLQEIQNKIQQNIINATIDGQESERKKIAAILHDNISALLSSARMHLNVFSTINKDQSAEILKTKNILEEAHHKVRDLSHELMPSLLVRFGLIYALDDLCEKNSNSTITFGFKSTLDTSLRFNENLETKLYFIVSELLNNIIKHSKATTSEVIVESIEKQLQITVLDNGKGFDIEDKKNIEGFGLNRIKARINNLKGDFVIISQKNIGTTVKIKVPF